MLGHVLVPEIISRSTHHLVGILMRQVMQIGYTSVFDHKVKQIKRCPSATIQRHLAMWICTCVYSCMADYMA